MNEIFHGDCLDSLPDLVQSGTADAVVTDPPYCSGGFTESQKKSATYQGLRSERVQSGAVKWFASDDMTTGGLLYLMRRVAQECFRVLVPGGSLLMFCDWRMVPLLVPCLESVGLRYTNLIVWDKGSMGLGSGFRPQHELIVHLTKGVGRYYAKNGANVITAKRVQAADKEHATEKPIELLRELVRIVSPPGGLVVDPFCGSGSTCRAAALEGRNFIGVEREWEFVEVARRRTSRALQSVKIKNGSSIQNGSTYAVNS